jgi:hypothetical protein
MGRRKRKKMNLIKKKQKLVVSVKDRVKGLPLVRRFIEQLSFVDFTKINQNRRTRG